MLENLTATQTRCTELLLEVRAYRASAGLPGLGWDCPACRVFNSDARKRLMSKRERAATPPAFRDVLLEIARSVPPRAEAAACVP